MKPYIVYIDDNFHYMDESERIKIGDYDDCQSAIVVCKTMGDKFLAGCDSNCTADEMFKHYTSCGEDPWIASKNQDCKFSAWDYAKDDGRVLITGGCPADFHGGKAQVFDPSAGTFSLTGLMAKECLDINTATLLTVGKVLFVGSAENDGLPSDAELYDPVAGTFNSLGYTNRAAPVLHSYTDSRWNGPYHRRPTAGRQRRPGCRTLHWNVRPYGKDEYRAALPHGYVASRRLGFGRRRLQPIPRKDRQR